MKKNSSWSDKFAHSVMFGLLVIVALIWFAVMAYIYISWVILPLFFSVSLEEAQNK
jgi:hypothetical protein